MEEITAEEILASYENKNDCPQDEGEELVSIDEGEE